MTSFWCLYYELCVDFKYCSRVSIADFDQVNASCVKGQRFWDRLPENSEKVVTFFLCLFVCFCFFFSLWAIIINNTSIKSTKTSKKLPRKVFLRQARNCPIRLFLWFIYLFNLVPSIYKLVFFLVKNFCYSRNYWALFVW